MRRVFLLFLVVLLAISGGSAFGQMGRGPTGPAIPTMSGQSGKVLTNNGSVASWSTLGTLSGVTGTGTAYYLPYWTSTGVIGALASLGTAGAHLVSAGAGAPPAWTPYFMVGTAAQTYTYPTTTATLARTDAANTFTGIQTFLGAMDGAKGADIASAATVNLCTATGNVVDITGATGPITSFGTCAAGTMRFVRFTGAPTITYNVTSMVLPGARSIDVAAGDRAVFVSLGSGNWFCHAYTKADGSVLGDQIYTTHAGTENVTALSMHGNVHLVTGAYTVTLPAVVVGMGGTFRATTAAVFCVDVQAADHHVLAGTALTAGYKVCSDGYAGSEIRVDAGAANTWYDSNPNGLFVDSGS